jgi:hypothetical protein
MCLQLHISRFLPHVMTVPCLQVLTMIQFSKDVASAQNESYKRIVMENSKLLLKEDVAEDTEVNDVQLREWWSRSLSAFQQVQTVLHDVLAHAIVYVICIYCITAVTLSLPKYTACGAVRG